MGVEEVCVWRRRCVCEGGDVCGEGGVCMEEEEVCVWRRRCVCGGGGVCVWRRRCVCRVGGVSMRKRFLKMNIK